MRACILVMVGIALTASHASARVCQGNAELSGTYGFAAYRTALVGLPSAFTGAFLNATAATTGTGTATGTSSGAIGGRISLPSAALEGIGGAVSGAASLEPFSRIGTVFFDGAGGISVAGGQSSALEPPDIGTYGVSSDCAVTVRLSNAFAFPNATTGMTTATTGTTTTTSGTPRFASPSGATFFGVLTRAADRVDMVETGTNNGTRLTLRRMFTNQACTNGLLNGSFGITVSGTSVAVSTGGVATFTPTLLTGTLIANGNGSFVANSVSTAAPPSQQLTGTYTVNADCTGTAHITTAAPQSTPMDLNFVLVRGNPVCGLTGWLSGSGIDLLVSQAGPGVFSLGEALLQ